MRAIHLIKATGIILLGSVSPALAAAGTREDSSGLLVWIFLAFCALIVLLQLAPAVMLAFGLVKGAADATVEARQERAEATIE